VRGFTEELCRPLEIEDYCIQTMTDVSPTKWHLAHTSWFFETLILAPNVDGYVSPNHRYEYLFNSYYNTVGSQHCRDQRGFISRPTVADVFDYRTHVDHHMLELLSQSDTATIRKVAPVLEIGLHHEQQHQELLLTDIKHVFATNPLRPAYEEGSTNAKKDVPVPAQQWIAGQPAVQWIGFHGNGFSYDNETPRHQEFLQPFALASRLVTNGDYLAFIEDGGYARPELWLSEGWATIQREGWTAPLYWEAHDDGWRIFTLTGLRALDTSEPVCHVSYFEADAFARWAGARLPTEAEWEVISGDERIEGNFVEKGTFHPAPLRSAENGKLYQLFGDVWEWTQSHYSPYPGYKAPEGALGEYNGKFMCNQFVLRGGSCATPQRHIRRTYRNFFPADARWQFTGVRLARDGEE
jgi:ergothioneine biosynthesis protein EgtB